MKIVILFHCRYRKKKFIQMYIKPIIVLFTIVLNMVLHVLPVADGGGGAPPLEKKCWKLCVLNHDKHPVRDPHRWSCQEIFFGTPLPKTGFTTDYICREIVAFLYDLYVTNRRNFIDDKDLNIEYKVYRLNLPHNRVLYFRAYK